MPPTAGRGPPGRPGVCSVTAGCGLTNAVTGLCTAGLAGSAVVCIAGQHPTTEDGLGSFQEAYGSEVCRSFSKSVKRVLDWSAIEVDLRQAFREATAPPQGVALVEIPTNILYQRGSESAQRRGAKVFAARRAPLGSAIPAASSAPIEILAAAERPLIVAGDGVFWSSAAAGAAAPSPKLTGIPVYARRARPGRAAGGPRARGPRTVEEAVHRSRRRGAGDRLSLLERREVRRGADLERGRALHPGRCHADADRPARAGRGGDRRRRQARPWPARRGGGQPRLDVPRPGVMAQGSRRRARRATTVRQASWSGRITTTCRSIRPGLRASSAR